METVLQTIAIVLGFVSLFSLYCWSMEAEMRKLADKGWDFATERMIAEVKRRSKAEFDLRIAQDKLKKAKEAIEGVSIQSSTGA